MDTKVRPLLLAGGKSSRMKRPKYLLPHPTGRYLFGYTLTIIQAAFPDEPEICISVRDEQQAADFANAQNVHFLFDGVRSDIGPAAGLLAAHGFDSQAHWLVIGCDYPLATANALRQLIDEHAGLLTCFDGTNGFCEPLFAIWSPHALEKLRDNVLNDMTGPMRVLKELNAKIIHPQNPQWVLGANTEDEWNRALELWHSSSGS